MFLEVLTTRKGATRHTKSIDIVDHKVEIASQNRKHRRGRRNKLFQDLVVCNTCIAVAGIRIDTYEINVTEAAC